MGANAETAGNPVIDVLVVDDSPVDRLFYRRLLTHGDGRWNVVDVASPEEAFAVCQHSQVRCVLTDYEFPEMNGIDLLEQLRGVSGLAAIPAVVITGGIEPTLVSRALAAGACAVFGKGVVNVRALRSAVEQALAGFAGTDDELLRAEFAYACVSTTGREREPTPLELAHFAVVAELSRLVKVLRARR